MDTNLTREDFLTILNLVKPALSNQNYVPALTHFCFDGAYAMAYNDVQAIAVRCHIGAECLVPGEMLCKMISSFTAKSLDFVEDKGNLLVLGGRSKLKLPILPVRDFTFDFPKSKIIDTVIVNAEFLKGLQACLVSVGEDTTHPAQMGITYEETESGVFLYSTDNFTLSRYRLGNSTEQSTPIILPTFFCVQLIAVGNAFPDEEIEIKLYNGAVVAEVGTQAKIFTKLVFDLEPLDFSKIFRKFVNVDKLKDEVYPTPLDMNEVFPRASLVLSGDTDKVTTVKVTSNKVKVSSVGSMGEIDEDILVDTGVDESYSFNIDPSLVTRALRVSTSLALLENVLVFMDDSGRFIHLVSHIASK